MKVLILALLFSSSLFAARGRTFKAYDDSFTNSVAQIYSKAMDIQTYSHVSIQYVYTLAGVGGECEMQVSNDGINYQAVGNSIALISATGTSFVNKANIAAKWMRAKCLNNDATPITMTIILSGK